MIRGKTRERSAWAELREDPVLYVRNRPQAVLIPLVFVLFVTQWRAPSGAACGPGST